MADINAYILDMWSLVESGDKQGYFFFIALYLLLVCGYSLIHQLNILKWPSVKGKLQKADVSKCGGSETGPSSQLFKASILYSYQVNNQSYIGHRLSPWLVLASYNAKQLLNKQISAIQHNEDASVKVFYNPNNPNKSFLIKPNQLGLLITLLLAICPIILYCLSFF